MLRRIKIACNSPVDEWLLAFEALAALIYTRLVLKFFPFATALAWLGLRQIDYVSMAANARGQHRATAEAIGRAIGRAAQISPLRAVCLQQAAAAAVMLRKRNMPAALYLGVAKDGNGLLEAHAWSVCGNYIITGKHMVSKYVPITAYSL